MKSWRYTSLYNANNIHIVTCIYTIVLQPIMLLSNCCTYTTDTVLKGNSQLASSNFEIYVSLFHPTTGQFDDETINCCGMEQGYVYLKMTTITVFRLS